MVAREALTTDMLIDIVPTRTLTRDTLKGSGAVLINPNARSGAVGATPRRSLPTLRMV